MLLVYNPGTYSPSLDCSSDLKSDYLLDSNVILFDLLHWHMALTVSCSLTLNFDVHYTVQLPKEAVYSDISCLVRRKTHVNIFILS
jgi:hypothetical protein